MKYNVSSTWRQGNAKVRSAEIDRTLKKTEECVEQFEATYARFLSSTAQPQKEKFQTELKTEVSKLRRYKSQINAWLAMNDVKDKSSLKRTRKLIETHVKTYTGLEKELKTKARLEVQAALNEDDAPDAVTKLELMESLQHQMSLLSLQSEQVDAEIHSLYSGSSVGKPQTNVASTRLKELETIISWCSWHLSRLELALRLLDNDSIQMDSVASLHEKVEYFAEKITDSTLEFEDLRKVFEEVKDAYDALNLPQTGGLDGESGSLSNEPQMDEGAESWLSTPSGFVTIRPIQRTDTEESYYWDEKSRSWIHVIEPVPEDIESSAPVLAATPTPPNSSATSTKEYNNPANLHGFVSASDPRILLLLRLVLDSQLPESALMELTNDDPQHVLDSVQNILDTSSFNSLLTNFPQSDDLRQVQRRLRRILLKLALQYRMLPLALFMTDVQCRTSECLGFGAFADVYCGMHQEQKVALKRLRVFQMSEPSKRLELMRAFYRESLLWKNLSHDYVLPLLGIDNQLFKETFCMVLPWMEHGNIRHTIDTIKQDANYDHSALFYRVEKWIEQIAIGLTYLHDESVVHGDLRGANILVDSNWNIKLADFGLSLFADGSSNNYASARGGAARWLAPELMDPEFFELQSSRPTFASDVYSFACACIELYTSGIAFAGFSETGVITRVMAGKRPGKPLFHGREQMSDRFWSLLGQCWAQFPQERIHADQIVELLTTSVSAAQTS